MHEQSIINRIINESDISACSVLKNLMNMLSSDIAHRIRNANVIDRNVRRISLYQLLDAVKVDTSNKTVREIADEILKL